MNADWLVWLFIGVVVFAILIAALHTDRTVD